MFSKRIYLFVFLAILTKGKLNSNPLETDNKPKVKVVVIDAGHGGKDPGCLGASSQEKNIALAIALKTGEYIKNNFKDVKVIFTRTTDVFIPLRERADIANKANADLFICIHANANDNTHAEGTETYVLGLHKSEENLKVAQRENASIFLEKDYQTTYKNFDPKSPESYIIFAIQQSVFLSQSSLFAKYVQEQFTKRVGRKNRGVRQNGYLVLHQTSMPGVLIETGFLTNREEEKFLNTKQGQEYMSSAIYRAFKEYKREIEGGEVPAPVNDVAKIVVKEEKKQVPEKKQPEKPIPEKPIYKVQLVALSKKKELNSENFNGVKDVSYYISGGLYRYVAGNSTDIKTIQSLKKHIHTHGYPNAFIIAFYQGKRISLEDAKLISEK